LILAHAIKAGDPAFVVLFERTWILVATVMVQAEALESQPPMETRKKFLRDPREGLPATTQEAAHR
jgi:hypothetical protein